MNKPSKTKPQEPPRRGYTPGTSQDRDFDDYGARQGFEAPQEMRDVRGQDWSGYDDWQEYN